MILTDYLKGEKLTEAKCRYDLIASTESYDIFESLLINKRGFNVGGLSFNCVCRPERWKKKNAGLAITKGSTNITSLTQPELNVNIAFGDINFSNDALIVLYNSDFKAKGITTIEIFIARGQRNNTIPIYNLIIDGELDEEMEALREQAVTKNVTG